MMDTENLINEVRLRPPLWDIKLKEYSNRDIKSKLWIEVAEAIFPNWDQFEIDVKNKEVKELQKKWRNLKDAFAREIRLQKMPSGSGKRDRKRYIYFNELLFLRGSTELKETSTNIEDNESMSQNTSAVEENDSFTNQTNNLPSVPRAAGARKRTSRPGTSFEAKVLEHIRSKNEAPEKEDADRLFLLSLLPMFHACSLEIKLWARIKIQEIMQQALQFRQPTESLPPQNLPNLNPSQSYLRTSTYTSSPSLLPGSTQVYNRALVNNPSNYMAMGRTNQAYPTTSAPSPLIPPNNQQDSTSFTYHNITSPSISETTSDIYSVYDDQ